MNAGIRDTYQHECSQSDISSIEGQLAGNTLADQLLVQVQSLVCRLRRWRQNARTRQQLASLAPELLRDVGLTESERREELTKPFWKD